MNINIAVGIIVFLHDLFTATWIGGLIAIGLTTLPAAKQTLGKSEQMKSLMDKIMKRQSVLVYTSMAGLVLTGLLLSRRAQAYTGLVTFGNTYSTLLSFKHMIVLAMIAFSLFRSLATRKLQPGQSGERLSILLLYFNIGLGVLVLLLSGLLATLS